MKRIAIFGSGGGSNAKSILEHFKDSDVMEVALIVSNRPDAGILDHAKEFNVDFVVLDRASFYGSEEFLDVLKKHKINCIALAGFLWLVPEYLVKAYPNNIINIHPALLPKYGGKGMYGMNVHKAVKEAGERESGITIHTIDEEYDRGRILYQERVALDESDSAEDIAAKVLKVEHANFARVIAEHLK